MAKKRQSKGRARSTAGRRRSARRSLVLERRNYVLMAAGVVLVILGYVLMRVDNQVESFVSLYLAPLIILGGYAEIAYAIMWKPREQSVEAPVASRPDAETATTEKRIRANGRDATTRKKSKSRK